MADDEKTATRVDMPGTPVDSLTAATASNDLARMVERDCRFNCDAESAYECMAHRLYRAARRWERKVHAERV